MDDRIGKGVNYCFSALVSGPFSRPFLGPFATPCTARFPRLASLVYFFALPKPGSCATRLRHLENQFAEILSLKKLHQRIWEGIDARFNMFLRHHLARR